MNQQFIHQQTIQQQINQHRQETMNLPPVYEQHQFIRPLIADQIRMSAPPPIDTHFRIR
ncbi:MAG: hypothetical protein ABFR33_09545 [Verrucomicrobiota bacterium]